MPSLKLYYTPGACSIVPHILLHEVDAPFEAQCIPMVKLKIQFPPDFEKLNPKRKVPVLIFDNEVITEVPGIATAIASVKSDAHLMGKTPLERARVYEWLNWLSGTLHSGGFGHLWRMEQYTTSTDKAALEAVSAKGRENIEAGFAMVEDRLGAREEGAFAVGDGFTAVDAFLLAVYRWGGLARMDMARYVKYTALVKQLLERPAVKATLEKEGLKFSVTGSTGVSTL